MEQDTFHTFWRPQHPTGGKQRSDSTARGRVAAPLCDEERSCWPCVPDYPDLVTESFQVYPLFDGLHLGKIQAHALQDAERELNLGDGESPFLIMRVMLEGRDCLSAPASRSNHALALSASSCGVFCTPDSRGKVELPSGHCRHVNLCFNPSGLQALLGDTPLPPLVQNFVDGKATPIAWQHATTALQRRSAVDVTIPYDNLSLRHLYLQSKALELTVEFLRLLNHDKTSREPHQSQVKRLVCNVQDLLTSAPAMPFTLEDLAQQLGSSPRQLNDAFRQHHGMTLFDWFHDWKMERARELVAQGEQSIKEIAFDLGYRHVSNFNLAFTKCFGQPPARFRTMVAFPNRKMVSKTRTTG
ncbi:MAG: helix-turn-helix transcriptional regulator [Magnetococcales bacterium]|nr:helix-turn-helix transcriptional regulator [Magnetococcales bacterium]